MLRRSLFHALAIGFIAIVVAGASGCSRDVPTMPQSGKAPDMAAQSGSESGRHQCWGEYLITMRDIYDAEGNLKDVDIDVQPMRSAEVHANVTNFVQPPNCGGAGCVKVLSSSVIPGDPYSQITAGITLTNPTNLTGRDVRGIIYPSSAEVRLETLGGEVMHSGLTTLYNLGTPEVANPYMAFNFEEMYRPFGPQATHGTSYVFLKLNSYKLFQMVYKIDASFTPDAPPLCNAREAVACFIPDPDGPIHPEGSNSLLLAVLTDWQNDVQSVSLNLSGFGEPSPQEMVFVGENPDNHTSTWQYLLTQGSGYPAGRRVIRLTATDPVETTTYMRDFAVWSAYDNVPPVWKIPGQEGIYDHISGPQFLWLFFYEAWDVSLPLQYIFYGNDQSSPFDGTVLKVVTSDQYQGYTPFGEAGGAPANVERFFGIRLKDAQGLFDDNMLEYSCTRYPAEARWSFIKDQPPNQDGILGSPAIGDVDGDGKDDIVVGAKNGRVYAYGGSGTGTQNTIIWEYNTGSEVLMSPALVDLNNDNKLDAVASSDNGFVYAIDGATGTEIWKYDTGAGAQMHCSPAIAYINGDSVPDILIGTGDSRMLALNGAGPPNPGDPNSIVIWQFDGCGPVASTPGLADVNGDDVADVCFGSHDTKVHMLDGATGEEIWFYYVGPGMNNIESGMVMTDVNGDQVPDAIFCAVNNQGETKSAVYALNGVNGDEIWVNGDIWGVAKRGPAPAHVNDDDIWDFIVTAYQTEQFSIYAIDGADGSVIYKKLGPNIDKDTPTNYSSPIVGDFTGDGHMNVMYGRQDGFVDLVNLGDMDLPGDFAGRNLFSMMVSTGVDLNKREIYGTPAMGDVDGDGEWELIACNMRGYTYVLDMHAPVPEDITLRPWTQHSGNRWHTGVPEFDPPK